MRQCQDRSNVAQLSTGSSWMWDKSGDNFEKASFVSRKTEDGSERLDDNSALAGQGAGPPAKVQAGSIYGVELFFILSHTL